LNDNFLTYRTAAIKDEVVAEGKRLLLIEENSKRKKEERKKLKLIVNETQETDKKWVFFSLSITDGAKT
jgi:hypothetical protein